MAAPTRGVELRPDDFVYWLDSPTLDADFAFPCRAIRLSDAGSVSITTLDNTTHIITSDRAETVRCVAKRINTSGTTLQSALIQVIW